MRSVKLVGKISISYSVGEQLNAAWPCYCFAIDR